MKYRKAAVAGIVITTFALAGMGTALAYWSVGGTGTGTATVAQVAPLVVTQVPVQNLLPSKPAVLVAKISNTNNFDISLAQQVVGMTPAIDKGHQACELGSFALTVPTAADSLVKANSSTDLVGGSVTLRDLPQIDQNACQGATLTFSYTLGVPTT